MGRGLSFGLFLKHVSLLLNLPIFYLPPTIVSSVVDLLVEAFYCEYENDLLTFHYLPSFPRGHKLWTCLIYEELFYSIKEKDS